MLRAATIESLAPFQVAFFLLKVRKERQKSRFYHRFLPFLLSINLDLTILFPILFVYCLFVSCDS